MKKTLSILIPVYNESERLEKTFSALADGLVCKQLTLTEIVFVNDGSTDNTSQMISEVKSELEKKSRSKVKVVTYKKNKGKGYAVKMGMLKASGDYLLLIDADISTPLVEIVKFEKYVRKDVNVVIGTRKNGKSTVIVAQPMYRQLLGRGFTLVSQIILNTWVSDFTCGFKLFSRNAYRKIGSEMKIKRWGYDAEVMFLSRKYGYDINEVAVKWSNDDRSKVRLVRDIIGSFIELLQIRTNDFRGVYTRVIRGNLIEKVFPWIQKA